MTVDPRRDLADRLAALASPAQVATADPLGDTGELSVGSTRASLGLPTESAPRLATCPAKSRPNSFLTEDAR